MKEIRYIRAVNEALREEMARDERVFIIGEDVGASGGAFTATRGLYQEFGAARVKDTPISESAIIGMALGAAMTGLRPVAEIMFMDFLAVCMDQIVNQVAKMRYLYGGQYKVPMVIRAPSGGGLSAGPHHSQCLENWFTHIPGLKVVMPSTCYDVKGLLKAAIRDDNPVLVIEHKGLAITGQIPEEEYIVPLGKADIKREGDNVTIVATSQMVFKALAAAEKLAAEGISAEVVDPRTLCPLDMETILNSVKKTGRLVVAHEAVKSCGFGAEIAARVMEEGFDYLDAPVKRVGAAFTPVPFGPALEKAYLPNENDIIKAVKEVV
ncbi:MAG: alpha-ketoacid dehydrogenase subunit beta [Chloroflexota bacterium]